MADIEKSITLESGRKVELKSPTRRQRSRIQDQGQECANRGISVSMEMCLDIVIACTGKSESILDAENWSDTEVIQCTNECFPLLGLTETDKKK